MSSRRLLSVLTSSGMLWRTHGCCTASAIENLHCNGVVTVGAGSHMLMPCTQSSVARDELRKCVGKILTN